VIKQALEASENNFEAPKATVAFHESSSFPMLIRFAE
jgi:hypothetical protein